MQTRREWSLQIFAFALLVLFHLPTVFAESRDLNYQAWKIQQQAHDDRLAAQLPKTPNSVTASQPLKKAVDMAAVSLMGSSTKIALNSATVEQLQQLDGVGEKKAKAIIAYRQKHGKFKQIDEIQAVDGIGTALFAKNKSRLAL